MSAAAAPPQDPLDQLSLDSVESSYNINVVGNWNLVKSVLNARTDKSKQTIIINVSTLAAYRPLPRQGVYGSSKAAFTQLITEFAREHDEEEVRFVSYHPGAVYTELASQHFSKDIFDGWEDVILPGQFAVWLASPEADFLNGRFVWAEWDVDELLEVKDKIMEDPYFLKISLIQ
jgi:NAD(P)-dependent dehydrogenase (short-subunit alcohol dehydrogenase family)